MPATKFDIILCVEQKYYTAAIGMHRMKTVDFASNRTLSIANSHQFIELAVQEPAKYIHKIHSNSNRNLRHPTLTKYWFVIWCLQLVARQFATFVITMNASQLITVEIGANLFSEVDYCVFGGLLLCSVAIGLYFGIFNGKEQTTVEYLHGGHQMQVVPISISLVTRFNDSHFTFSQRKMDYLNWFIFVCDSSMHCSVISAWTIMAVPAEIYSFGWLYILMIPAMGLLTLAANLLFVPVYHQNSIDNCYAVSNWHLAFCRFYADEFGLQYLEMRFSKSVRKIVSTTAVLYAMFYMPITLYLPSLAFSEGNSHSRLCTVSQMHSIQSFRSQFPDIIFMLWTRSRAVVVSFTLCWWVYGVPLISY